MKHGAAGQATVSQMYATPRTPGVEQVTGVLIKGAEQISKTYEAPGYEPLAKTVGTIGFDEATVKKNAEDWGAKAGLLSFINGPLTMVGLLLGALIAGIGAWMLLARGREDQASGDTRRSRT